MLTEVDKEIIVIIKETFRKKNKDEFIDPDDLNREFIIKLSFFMSLILFILSLFSDNTILSTMTASLISVFFMLLFFQLNIKSKNPSIIMYGLTFISVMIPIWI